tara:strand:+ start:265 stop:513 length:249 start_codon:yes stop_codon:yes gene_type:complete
MTTIDDAELERLRYMEEKYKKVKMWRNKATQNWREKNRDKYNASMRDKYKEKKDDVSFKQKNRENAKKHYYKQNEESKNIPS